MRRCTDITLILDKSDSMSNCHGATIEMVNPFIEDRRKDPDECILSLVQFSSSNPYADPLTRTFVGSPIKESPRIDSCNYCLYGRTALLDAMGITIKDVGKRLSGMPEDDRPDRVLIVVMTDGQENDSIKFTHRQVVDMTNHQRDHYRWEFMFLGADMDSFTAEKQAQALGIYANNTMNYRKSSTREAGKCMTQSVANYAGPVGAQGPQGPQGPGIFALDAATQVKSKKLRQEANTNSSVSVKAPPKKSNGKSNGKPSGKRGKK